MKKLSPTKVSHLLDMLSWPKMVKQSEIGLMKACRALAENKFCIEAPYQKDYRANLYQDGSRFAVTADGVDAIRKFGNEDALRQLKGIEAGKLVRCKSELEKLEIKANELRAYISLFDVQENQS